MSFFALIDQFTINVIREYLPYFAIILFILALYSKYEGMYKEAAIFIFLAILSLLYSFSEPFIFLSRNWIS